MTLLSQYWAFPNLSPFSFLLLYLLILAQGLGNNHLEQEQPGMDTDHVDRGWISYRPKIGLLQYTHTFSHYILLNYSSIMSQSQQETHLQSLHSHEPHEEGCHSLAPQGQPGDTDECICTAALSVPSRHVHASSHIPSQKYPHNPLSLYAGECGPGQWKFLIDPPQHWNTETMITLQPFRRKLSLGWKRILTCNVLQWASVQDQHAPWRLSQTWLVSEVGQELQSQARLWNGNVLLCVMYLPKNVRMGHWD